MLQKVVELRQTEVELEISVVKRSDVPETWTVEAVETDGDGSVYQAMFIGPDAEARAHEYRTFKYGLA